MSASSAEIASNAVSRRASGSRRLALGACPRPPRIQIAGGIYHVTSRGNRRQSIYLDDDDRRCFLALRDRVIAGGLALHAYCLMTNHFHLLPRDADAEPRFAGMHG